LDSKEGRPQKGWGVCKGVHLLADDGTRPSEYKKIWGNAGDDGAPIVGERGKMLGMQIAGIGTGVDKIKTRFMDADDDKKEIKCSVCGEVIPEDHARLFNVKTFEHTCCGCEGKLKKGDKK